MCPVCLTFFGISLLHSSFLINLFYFFVGSGLHTFVLYLGPHIAFFTIKATQCGRVDLKSAPYDTIQFKSGPSWLEKHCSDFGAPVYPSLPGSRVRVSMSSILPHVQLEAFLWGLGTALGELPPFFISRAGKSLPKTLLWINKAWPTWTSFWFCWFFAFIIGQIPCLLNYWLLEASISEQYAKTTCYLKFVYAWRLLLCFSPNTPFWRNHLGGSKNPQQNIYIDFEILMYFILFIFLKKLDLVNFLLKVKTSRQGYLGEKSSYRRCLLIFLEYYKLGTSWSLFGSKTTLGDMEYESKL